MYIYKYIYNIHIYIYIHIIYIYIYNIYIYIRFSKGFFVLGFAVNTCSLIIRVRRYITSQNSDICQILVILSAGFRFLLNTRALIFLSLLVSLYSQSAGKVRHCNM